MWEDQKVRLEYYFESKSLLPKPKYGIRMEMSTDDALYQLITAAQISYSKHLVCLFLDIKSAYYAEDLGIL